MGGRTNQKQRECGAAGKAQLRLETMNMQGHQPARLWFFLAAPSSLQVQRRQEHRSKAECKRKKTGQKLMILARKVVEMMGRGVSMLNKRETAENGEKTEKRSFGIRA